MRVFSPLIFVAFGCVLSSLAGGVEVQHICTYQLASGVERIAVDTSARATFHVPKRNASSRFFVDIKGGSLHRFVGNPVIPEDSSAERLTLISSAQGLRLDLSLSTPAKPQVTGLPPNDHHGHRIVIDLFPESDHGAAGQQNPLRESRDSRDSSCAILRPVRVAIDAGHGVNRRGQRMGSNSGKIIINGKETTVFEDPVVFSVSKFLYSYLDSQPGVRPFLVREDEREIDPSERAAIARRKRADVLISIHTDKAKDQSTIPRGPSVYIFDQNEAEKLAADFLRKRAHHPALFRRILGVSPADKSAPTDIILDLVRTGVAANTQQLADSIIQNLGRITNMHSEEIKQKKFAMLNSFEISSILVEIGFLSNPRDVELIASPSYRKKVAHTLGEAIMHYLLARADLPPDSLLASLRRTSSDFKRYMVKKGDTLYRIARNQNIPVSVIVRTNGISGNLIHPGEILFLPHDDTEK